MECALSVSTDGHLRPLPGDAGAADTCPHHDPTDEHFDDEQHQHEHVDDHQQHQHVDHEHQHEHDVAPGEQHDEYIHDQYVQYQYVHVEYVDDQYLDDAALGAGGWAGSAEACSNVPGHLACWP